ncbi:MAG: hypothetical protein AAF430_08775 [Myxococcota bacterium]
MRASKMSLWVALTALCVGLGSAASAQELMLDTRDAVEVDRDGVALIDAIRVPEPDRDVADTAIVLTNFGPRDQKVVCGGFNKNGRAVGRVWVKVPAHGLRYVLASDLADDLDFIGSAQCAASGNIRGSAIFLGPGLTDLPVQQIHGAAGRLRFPLVATY